MYADAPFNSFDYLRAHGIKPSVQRMAIADYLNDNRIHPTVDDVYLALVSEIPTLSKTTVYNTLHLFLENQAVTALYIDDKTLHFDINTKPHTHFLCKSCNKIYDLMEADIPMPIKPHKVGDFIVQDLHLYMYGICPNCQKNKEILKN